MDKNNQKKPVNKLVLIILALLVIGGCVFAYLKNKARNDALNSLTIDFVNNQTADGVIQLEYDLAKIDPLTLVTNHTGTIEASVCLGKVKSNTSCPQRIRWGEP